MHLNFTINKEILDSATYISKNKEKLKEYNDINVLNPYEFISDIFQLILNKKGDWGDMEYDETLGNSNATIDLIYYDDEKDSEINEILEMVEKYISNNNDIKDTINIDNSFENDGFLIFFDGKNDLGENIECTDEDVQGINLLELESKFREENIDFKKLSLKVEHFEGGCSSILGKALYFFLTNILLPGIAYDTIKEIAKKIKVYILDGKSFKKVRKDIAELMGIEEMSLAVKEFHKMVNDIEFIFEVDNRIINVKTDLNYNILECKVCNDNLSK